jgi:hypothetical protein
MDTGIASEANLTWLEEHGYKYIVVSRRLANKRTAADIKTNPICYDASMN